MHPAQKFVLIGVLLKIFRLKSLTRYAKNYFEPFDEELLIDLKN